MKDQAHHTGSVSLVQKLRQQVENNLHNEQFGVQQLADNMNISRSQLHRKLKKSTGQSVNQFIREYRLQRALELLKQGDKTVSEIAFEVGFGSHSYFTTCFTEHYGYPPGEVKYRLTEPSTSENQREPSKNWPQPFNWSNKLGVVGLITLGLLLSFLLLNPWFDSTSNKAITNKSIAVLPFKNMSGDPEQEAMCDGLTDEIIHRLSLIKSFDKVISLSSVMTFKNSDKTLTEIARQLKVDIVLEGSFKQSGDVIRITAQLIDAVNDDHLWSEVYEQPFGDIFDIQSKIAISIASKFSAEITPIEKRRIGKKPTVNLEAYMYWMQANYKLSNGDHRGGIDLIKKAIQADSLFAEGYVRLARAYLLTGNYFLGDKSVPVEDPLHLAEKALTLDPELGEAHLVLGQIKHYKEWKFVEAEDAYKKALELDPKTYEAIMFFYPALLVQVERTDEALAMLKKAIEINPMTYLGVYSLSRYYCFANKKEQAAEIMKKYPSIFSDIAPGAMGVHYLCMDSLAQAIEHLDKAKSIPLYHSFLAIAFAKSGAPLKAKHTIQQLKEKIPEARFESLNYSIGLYYSAIGQVEEALYWLERAYDSHDTELYWLKTEPNFKSLHGHPRYEALLKKIGFPE